MIGYRTEQLYGEWYRDAASVMAHEVFVLGNTEILDILSETLLKNTRYCKQLLQLSDVINENVVDDNLEAFLDEAFDNENIRIDYFNVLLDEIKKITGKDIKYVLWLCDSIEESGRQTLAGL